jgi:hypothetical protein
MKAYVWNKVLYASETWIIGNADVRRLEAFEVWLSRRKMRISWEDKVTNEEVFKRNGEKINLWKNFVKTRDALTGHLLRLKEA